MAKIVKMYMDESCHTKNDSNKCMSLVTIYTLENNSFFLENKINSIKNNYKIGGELKWNKVSNSNISLYKDVLSLFAEYVNTNLF